MTERTERPNLDRYLEQLGRTSAGTAAAIRAKTEADAELADQLEANLSVSPELAQTDAALRKDYQERQLDHRQWLVERRFENAGALDKLLISLATGALALSVVLLTKVGVADGHPMLWLRAGWASLVLCIVAVVGSIAASQRALAHEIEHVDALIMAPPSALRPTREEPKLKRWAGRLTAGLNAVAGIAFAGGLAATLIFAVLTISQEEQGMAGDKEKQGYVPSPPPPAPQNPSPPPAPPNPNPAPKESPQPRSSGK